tara:strand:+ start:264 stop:656 length:393 start_codon:yes stop_codon:yes gene_type:complete
VKDEIEPSEIKTLLELVANDGLTIDRALQARNISRERFDRWCEGNDDPDRGRARIFELAEISHEINLIRDWHQRAQAGDWRAARDFLAHRHPEQWGKYRKVETETPPQDMVFTVNLGQELWGDGDVPTRS